MKRLGIPSLNGIAVTLFALCIAAGAVPCVTMHQPAPVVVGGLLGVYLLFAIKVVRRWERVALLRLGNISDCAGRACSTSFLSSRR